METAAVVLACIAIAVSLFAIVYSFAVTRNLVPAEQVDDLRDELSAMRVMLEGVKEKQSSIQRETNLTRESVSRIENFLLQPKG